MAGVQNNALPSARDGQAYMSVCALEGGFLTLPEHLFITNADPNERVSVPSLAFLIEHPSKYGEAPTRLVFDLGLKRDLAGYALAQQHHISNRQPVKLSPDVRESLRAGDLDAAEDIDIVMVSHMHWDHVRTSSDFSKAQFIVGAGTLHVLEHGAGPLYPAEIFNKDELPVERSFELPPTNETTQRIVAKQQTRHKWELLATVPSAIDFFGDGSLYVIDTPGHLLGHINLLARIRERQWVFLGGDCCHDKRILDGQSGIAMYNDGRGGLRSVHMDTEAASSLLNGVRELSAQASGEQVEVVIAHDLGWMEKNQSRFFPGKL